MAVLYMTVHGGVDEALRIRTRCSASAATAARRQQHPMGAGCPPDCHMRSGASLRT